MLFCKLGRVHLRRGISHLMGGRLYQNTLTPGNCEDVRRGLRNGAMSQQTLPVFITDTLHSQLPTSIGAGSASAALCTMRNGSALAMDSQGNAVTVNTQSQQASAECSKSKSSSTDRAYVKSPAYNGKSKQHKQFSKILRTNLASEAAAVNMFAAQSKLGKERPDITYFQVTTPLHPNASSEWSWLMRPDL